MSPSSFFPAPVFVKHEIRGREYRFYPISGGELFRLKALAGDLFSAITALFAAPDEKKLRVHMSRNWTGPSYRAESRDAKGAQVEPQSGENGFDSSDNPPPLDYFRHRSVEQQEAMRRITDALTDQKNFRTFMRIVCDCLREDFERKDGTVLETQVDAAMDENPDLGTMTQLLVGVWKANEDTFRPFADLIRLKIERARQALEVEPVKVKTPEPTAAIGG